MKEVKSPRKPFLIYALVVAVIILLLNGDFSFRIYWSRGRRKWIMGHL